MCHILIIEDDPFIAADIAELLLGSGASSLALAATEQEAITAADNQPPAVIVSDVRLLDGSGPRAAESILMRHGQVPVIFVTGSPEDCASFPIPAIVLKKPFVPAELLAAIGDAAVATPTAPWHAVPNAEQHSGPLGCSRRLDAQSHNKAAP